MHIYICPRVRVCVCVLKLKSVLKNIINNKIAHMSPYWALISTYYIH